MNGQDDRSISDAPNKRCGYRVPPDPKDVEHTFINGRVALNRFGFAWLLGTHLFGPRPRAALGDSAMDAELLELQRQFESAQQAKPSVRLSERNVVELVQKLHELRIIDFDLLHTVSGKEYITPVRSP